MKIKLELILDKEEAEVIIERAELKPTTFEECVEQYVFEHIVDNLPQEWLPQVGSVNEENEDT